MVVRVRKAAKLIRAPGAPEGAASAWIRSTTDADSKLIVSYMAGNRTSMTTIELMNILRFNMSS